MGKLWEKDYGLDVLVERFTVGDDYLLDGHLVQADCAGSCAHAAGLERIGILSPDEYRAIRGELAAIAADHLEGRFTVAPSDEDVHTAIENRLTDRLGEAGKKVHTGRSRNDQVLTALRIYGRGYLLAAMEAVLDLSDRFLEFAGANREVPMPGRTHLQIAMPSSVGLWAAAWAEELLDDARLLSGAYRLNDQCPLGSAASYGVPLPLDREFVADRLGFSRVQRNVLYANNSRGKIESIILDAADQCVLTLSKVAQDLILFSLPEFGYFSLPKELCSGSSIMPQKRNPDVLELLRARSATLTACAQQTKGIIRSLPSGYNRDFQETKEPFIRGTRLSIPCLEVMSLTVERLEVNPGRLAAGMVPEIYATDEAIRMVTEGRSFRDAYREVGRTLDRVGAGDPLQAIRSRTSVGTAGNLMLDQAEAEAAELRAFVRAEDRRVGQRLEELLGTTVRPFRP